jgi:hypothetical protein
VRARDRERILERIRELCLDLPEVSERLEIAPARLIESARQRT